METFESIFCFSLSLIPLISIQVVTGITGLAHFIAESCSVLWIHYSNHSLIEGNLSCSQFLALMNRIAMDILWM